MSARCLVLPLLALLWFWPAVARSQSCALLDTYNRSCELSAQGRYQQARPFAEKALQLDEQEFGPDHRTTATLLNELARLYHAQGKYADAEPLYQRLRNPIYCIFINKIQVLCHKHFVE